MELKNKVKSIVIVMKNAMTWLKEAADVCNKSKGSPFEQCMKTFETNIVECR